MCNFTHWLKLETSPMVNSPKKISEFYSGKCLNQSPKQWRQDFTASNFWSTRNMLYWGWAQFLYFIFKRISYIKPEIWFHHLYFDVVSFHFVRSTFGIFEHGTRGFLKMKIYEFIVLKFFQYAFQSLRSLLC